MFQCVSVITSDFLVNIFYHNLIKTPSYQNFLSQDVAVLICNHTWTLSKQSLVNILVTFLRSDLLQSPQVTTHCHSDMTDQMMMMMMMTVPPSQESQQHLPCQNWCIISISWLTWVRKTLYRMIKSRAIWCSSYGLQMEAIINHSKMVLGLKIPYLWNHLLW